MRRKLLTAALFVVLLILLIPSALAAPASKLAALTFDDGPSEHTDRLLDGLSERGVFATFFVQGFKAEANPGVIYRMIEEGHQVANHSYNHPDMYTIPEEDALEQFICTDRILNRIIGTSGAHYYRAPYGNSTEQLRAMLKGPLFYWSLDSEDWLTRNEGMIRNKLITEMFDGAIVLLHDTVAGTVDATLDAVDHLQDQGYEFVTLKELFRRRGAYTEAGEQYYSYLPSHTLLPELEQPMIWAEGLEDQIRITMKSPSGVPIYYTVDGSAVTFESERYEGSFVVSLPCTIRAVAALDLNGARSRELFMTYSEIPVAEEQEAEQVEDLELIMEEQDDEYTFEANLTRAELAQSLYDLFGNNDTYAEEIFSDVSALEPYAEAVTWGYYSGLFSGTGDGHFEPDRQVTRQELAKVLACVLNLRADGCRSFADEELIESWAWDAVQAVTEHGIMEADRYFRPYDAIEITDYESILNRIA